jgi:hypothetical protein
MYVLHVSMGYNHAVEFRLGCLLVLKFVKPRLLHVFECKVLEVKAAPCTEQHERSTMYPQYV